MQSKYWSISFPGEHDQFVTEVWSEEQILDSYYEYWFSKMSSVGKSDESYLSRFEKLTNKVNSMTTKPRRIWLVSSQTVNGLDAAKCIFEEYLSLGYEGIILKNQSSGWEPKRAKHQVKFKGEKECEMKIVGVEEGSGKYAGMLGAILCESSDGIIKVSVGSGFSDSQRKLLWHENLVDKIVSIKYNERISNKNGEQSLFLPIFTEVRYDKNVADDSKSIS